MSGELTAYFYGAINIFARCLGFFALFPFGHLLAFFGMRFSFALVFSFLFLQQVVPVSEISLLQVVLEFVLGLALVLPMLVFFDLLGSLGEVIDAIRGQTIALQYNPLSEGLESVGAQLLRLIFWCLLLQAGIFEYGAQVLQQSFMQPLAFNTGDVSVVAEQLLTLVAASGANAFKVFLPVALLLISIDLLIAGLQSALPQANLVNEAFLLKSLLAGGFILLAGHQGTFADWMITTVQLPSGTLKVLSGLMQ